MTILQLPPVPPQRDHVWKVDTVELAEKWFADGTCVLYLNGELFKIYHHYDRPPFIEIELSEVKPWEEL